MARLRLEHNLEPDELAMALASTALGEGVSDDLVAVLAKSRQGGGGEEPLEPAVRAVIAEWARRHQQLLRLLDDNLDRWVTFKKAATDPGALSRVVPFFFRPKKAQAKNVPDVEDVREASWLIAEHYRLAAGFGSGHWESPYGPVWERAGLTVPLIDLADLAAQAYLAGRGIPLGTSRPDLHAATFAAAHAGTFITGVGNRMGTIVLERGVSTLAETYHDTIANFVSAHLRGAETTPEMLWRGLADVLTEVVGGADPERDMNRVAQTETRWSYNVGLVQTYVERGVKQVCYLVQPEACDKCKRLYLKRDGTPRVFSLGEIVRDIGKYGGLNAYRSERQLRPSALVHPNCHCVPLPVGEPLATFYAPRKPTKDETPS